MLTTQLLKKFHLLKCIIKFLWQLSNKIDSACQQGGQYLVASVRNLKIDFDFAYSTSVLHTYLGM